MVDRKTRKSPLTKQMFWAIKRTISANLAVGTYDAHRIGLEHDVSDETVRAVRRTGTWPKYEAVKLARNLRRGRTHQVPVPPVAPWPLRGKSASEIAQGLVDAFDAEANPTITKSPDKKTVSISVEDYKRLVTERNEYRDELAKSSSHNTRLQIDLLAATRRWSWLPWRSN